MFSSGEPRILTLLTHLALGQERPGIIGSVHNLFHDLNHSIPELCEADFVLDRDQVRQQDMYLVIDFLQVLYEMIVVHQQLHGVQSSVASANINLVPYTGTIGPPSQRLQWDESGGGGQLHVSRWTFEKLTFASSWATPTVPST